MSGNVSPLQMLSDNPMLREALHLWFSGTGGLIPRVKERARALESAANNLFGGSAVAAAALKFLKNLVLLENFESNNEHCNTLSSTPTSAIAVAAGMAGVGETLHATLKSKMPSPVKGRRKKKEYTVASLQAEREASKKAFVDQVVLEGGAVEGGAAVVEAVIDAEGESAKAAAVIVLKVQIGRAALDVQSTLADWKTVIHDLKSRKGGGARGTTAARNGEHRNKMRTYAAAGKAVAKYNMLGRKINAAALEEIAHLDPSPTVSEMMDTTNPKAPPPFDLHVMSPKLGHEEEELLSYKWVKYMALSEHQEYCKDSLKSIDAAFRARSRACDAEWQLLELNEGVAGSNVEIKCLGMVMQGCVFQSSRASV